MCRRVARHPVQAPAGPCTVLQRCKQPGNQATKRPSDQATKRPSDQAIRQPGNQATRTVPAHPRTGRNKRPQPSPPSRIEMLASNGRPFHLPRSPGTRPHCPTLRIAFDLDCTRGFPVPPRRRRAFHYQLSSIPVARDAASLARRLESSSTSTARAAFRFHLGDDAHSTINFHPSRSPGTRPHWPDASNHRRPRLHARLSGSTSAATRIPLSTRNSQANR